MKFIISFLIYASQAVFYPSASRAIAASPLTFEASAVLTAKMIFAVFQQA